MRVVRVKGQVREQERSLGKRNGDEDRHNAKEEQKGRKSGEDRKI